LRGQPAIAAAHSDASGTARLSDGLSPAGGRRCAGAAKGTVARAHRSAGRGTARRPADPRLHTLLQHAGRDRSAGGRTDRPVALTPCEATMAEGKWITDLTACTPLV